MNEVLLNDEDMSLMYLTDADNSGGESRDPRQHQEIEMLFENYLLQVTRQYHSRSVRKKGLPTNRRTDSRCTDDEAYPVCCTATLKS